MLFFHQPASTLIPVELSIFNAYVFSDYLNTHISDYLLLCLFQNNISSPYITILSLLSKFCKCSHRRELVFEIGDISSICCIRSWLLSIFGPFEVLERVGVVVYLLKLPPDSKIHNVSQMKPVIGKDHQV